MTTLPANAMCEACPARRSTLPFDLADMIAVRLLPAQFARVVGVSKQSVSKWIRAGKVTIGPDGRLDPVAAIQEVLRNTAPAKLRARIFRQAMNGADALQVENRRLQQRCARLEDETRAAHAALAAAEADMQRERAVVGSQQAAAVDAARYEEARVARAFLSDLLFGFDGLTSARASGFDALRWEIEQLQARSRERAIASIATMRNA